MIKSRRQPRRRDYKVARETCIRDDPRFLTPVSPGLDIDRQIDRPSLSSALSRGRYSRSPFSFVLDPILLPLYARRFPRSRWKNARSSVEKFYGVRAKKPIVPQIANKPKEILGNRMNAPSPPTVKRHRSRRMPGSRPERNRRYESEVQNKENNMASINFRGKQSPTLAYNGGRYAKCKSVVRFDVTESSLRHDYIRDNFIPPRLSGARSE